MKHLIITILCMLSLTAYADEYKVIYVNHGKVMVNKRAMTAGMVFDSDSSITWTEEGQLVKVMNCTTRRLQIITSESMLKSGASSLNDLLTQKKTLSSREGLPASQWAMANVLKGQNALFQEIRLKCLIPISEDRFYFAQYEWNDEVVNKKLRAEKDSSDNYYFILDSELYRIDGVQHAPFDLTMQLFLYDAKPGGDATTSIVAEDIQIMATVADSCRQYMQLYELDTLGEEDRTLLVEQYLQTYYPEINYFKADLESFLVHLP